MKFVRTVVVFDRGGLLDSEQWAAMHESYVKALRGVVHPPGNDQFVIRKKIKVKTKKLTATGKPKYQWRRNGVGPIQKQFLRNLKQVGWHSEKPAGLGLRSAALQEAHAKADVLLKEYPGKRDFRIEDQNWCEIFHEKVGDFDFFTELEGGVRCVIEWETGNISSSHRSMNRL